MGRPKIDNLSKKAKQLCILISEEDLEVLKNVENHFNFSHSEVFRFGLSVLSSSLEKRNKTKINNKLNESK